MSSPSATSGTKDPDDIQRRERSESFDLSRPNMSLRRMVLGAGSRARAGVVFGGELQSWRGDGLRRRRGGRRGRRNRERGTPSPPPRRQK
ncbi:hypothetical protein Q8A67_001379 [Cirrhinus molitorella]|uniref:Uncharacterized protein n=1 Tax=Cirrhinus molitorella TaxID=172907 RepID=A0AA88U114_9TELE|nr:hypothetical protein Q8A67_001379 [Cirrhinus molitorella]